MAETDLTHDAFLGGRIYLWQPRRGYRAGVDPILLAASVCARPGDSVLELGCGAGAAALCLAERVPGLSLTGVEVQDTYAALAIRNAAEHGTDIQVVNADLRALPLPTRQMQFSHVLMNPPYFDRNRGSSAQDQGRDLAFAGETRSADWIDVGLKRLAPKGSLTLIQRIERLPEILSAIGVRLGSIVVWPIAGRDGHEPERFLLRGLHSGRAPFRILSPLVLHSGTTHDADRESYTPQIQAVLRTGAALDWPL